MSKSNIGWTQYTLNPYQWKCQKRSPGCQHCYMMTLAERRGQDPLDGFGTRWVRALAELAAMPAGAVAFINSMSDTYYELAPDADVHRVHNMALSRPDVTFLVLTKRPERAYYMRHQLAWPDNLWLGVSVENQDYLWRIDYALATPAKHVFVSAEPLLGHLGVMLMWYMGNHSKARCPDVPDDVHDRGLKRTVDWVICGGESGAGRRPMEKRWAASIMRSCLQYEVPFFYKQGNAPRPGQDRVLLGKVWEQVPESFGWVADHADPVAVPSGPVQLEMFGGVA